MLDFFFERGICPFSPSSERFHKFETLLKKKEKDLDMHEIWTQMTLLYINVTQPHDLYNFH